jgi:hypothetical protein
MSSLSHCSDAKGIKLFNIVRLDLTTAKGCSIFHSQKFDQGWSLLTPNSFIKVHSDLMYYVAWWNYHMGPMMPACISLEQTWQKHFPSSRRSMVICWQRGHWLICTMANPRPIETVPLNLYQLMWWWYIIITSMSTKSQDMHLRPWCICINSWWLIDMIMFIKLHVYKILYLHTFVCATF